MKKELLDKIVGIQKVLLSKHDKIVVHVDVSKYPATVGQRYLTNIKDELKKDFPDNNIIVLSKNIEISIISPTS